MNLGGVLLLALALLGACGGGDDAGGDGTEPAAAVRVPATATGGGEAATASEGSAEAATSEVTSTPPAADAIGETQTSDGLDLTLKGVEASALRTEITFDLDLPDFAVSSDRESPFGVFKPGEDILLDNVSLLDPDSTSFSSQLHLPGEEQFQFTMVLGPVDDPAQPVSVTFGAIPMIKNRDIMRLPGPWRFRIPPDLLTEDSASNSQAVGETVEHDGVAVTVGEVERGSSGMAVHYTVKSDRDKPVMPFGLGVQLVPPDQPPVKPLRMNSADGDNNPIQPGRTRAYVAEFDVPENASDEVHLKFGPYVTGNGIESSVTVNDPFGDWSAEPVTINGERFEVTKVIQIDKDEDNQQLKLVVANQEPVSEATVLFHGVNEARVTASDGQNRNYRVMSSSTGMRRPADRSLMGAGTSTFALDVTNVNQATVKQLTVTVNHSSLLLRGPYAFDIELS